ncbi:heparin lyase I family protein [Hyphobacterium sp. CCMP332]|nr:heparin lyase I family protein [Hyphobacterium sp. CCMP332]
MNKYLHLFVLSLFLLISCRDDALNVNNGCPPLKVVSEFVNQGGDHIRIFEDGKAYYVNESGCSFAAQYFDPNFYADTYLNTDSGIYLIISEGEYLSPIRNQYLDFEGFNNTLDIFRMDISQDSLFLNSFTLQSPSAPTVEDYVALRKCIFEGTCDFIDNKFELIPDPVIINNNTVLKFYAVPPSPSMTTSKSSVSTTLSYFEKGDDFWFEAKFYISGNLPTTLADFESSFFFESPGPRIIFRGDQLAIENKFNEKLTFDQPEQSAIPFPTNQWVTVKVHLTYDVQNGIVQMWQDGELIIDQIGPTIPLELWIHDRIEFGISATSNECTLYMDDIRFSDEAF